MGVLLQGFYKLPPNDAVPSPADGKPGFPWWWDHIAAQARAFSLVGFTAIWLPPMLKTVIITSQVERFAHASNVSLRKKRANVRLKARFRHCSSQPLDYTYAALVPRDSKP